jgi:hypothetical protein
MEDLVDWVAFVVTVGAAGDTMPTLLVLIILLHNGRSSA